MLQADDPLLPVLLSACARRTYGRTRGESHWRTGRRWRSARRLATRPLALLSSCRSRCCRCVRLTRHDTAWAGMDRPGPEQPGSALADERHDSVSGAVHIHGGRVGRSAFLARPAFRPGVPSRSRGTGAFLGLVRVRGGQRSTATRCGGPLGGFFFWRCCAFSPTSRVWRDR